MEEVHYVLMSGPSKAVKSILQSGIDLRASIDSNERTAVHYLAKNLNLGVADVIGELFGHTSDNQNESKIDFIKSIFFIDSSKNSQTIQSELIHWDARDKDGRTPLHHAMAAANVNFVKFLVNKGIEVNVKTADGVTPFFEVLESFTESMSQQHIECVKIIMESGLNPEYDIERYLEIRNTESDIDRDFPLLQPLIAHLILRQQKGEQISEKLLESIDCHPKLKEYVIFCKGLLDKMKQEKSDRGSENLFEFLTTEDYSVVFSLFYGHSKLEKIINNYKLHTFYFSILQQRLSQLSKKRCKDFEKMFKLTVLLTIKLLFLLLIFYNKLSKSNILFEKMLLLLTGQVVSLSLILITIQIILYLKNPEIMHAKIVKP